MQGPVAVMATMFVNGQDESAVAESLAGAVVDKL